MTVALFLTGEPETVNGSPAFSVTVRNARTGQLVGEFMLVFPGNGEREYVTASGRAFSDLDDVLRAIVSRPDQAAA